MKTIAVVGAGLSGAVIARELVDKTDCSVELFEERPHVAGQAHTERDAETGVMEHVYGPHIFNTNHRDVLDYLGRFTEWVPHTNRVKAVNRSGVFSLPINLHTINQLFDLRLNPEEAEAFIRSQAVHFDHAPRNFEEQALSLMGRRLYETFFLGYTRKQWGCSPELLPADIIRRLPIRFNYNDSFYQTKHQCMPRHGYTALVAGILDHPRITLRLGERFSAAQSGQFEHVVFTGPLDAFFGHRLGRLGYRTVTFERKRVPGDYQGNGVINYTDETVDYTRVHQHNYFSPWESHEMSLVLIERSRATAPEDTPYYPTRLAPDLELLAAYQALAASTSRITFAGRLGCYRYLDMDQVVGSALDLVRTRIETGAWPLFADCRGK